MQFASDFESLDPNLVPAERVGSKILIGILSLIGLVIWCVLALLVLEIGSWKLWGIALGTITLVGGIGWLSMMEPVWRLKSTRLREVQNGIELHRGLFWRHQIFIPRERIQHTDILQGPIARRYGIASLIINTAGTHNHQITIDGLAMERAAQLRNSLLPRAIESSLVSSNQEPHKSSISQVVLDSEATPNETTNTSLSTKEEPIPEGIVAEAIQVREHGLPVPDAVTTESQVTTEKESIQPSSGTS